MSRPVWRLRPDRRAEARAVREQFGLNPVVAHVLLNREVPTDQQAGFLSPTAALCADPLLLTDLDRAAARLQEAVEQRQKVVVYGDYDADGACAGALVWRFLQQHGVPCDYYVPSRFEEGYGVNAQAVVSILTRHKPALLLTVDCGIGSAAELETAIVHGVDVIVTDHHQVPERLPNAPAINPHRPDSTYPFRELCGTAVVWKLVQEVARRLGDDLDALEDEFIELVAIATVADVMPLQGENRYFVRRGLAALSAPRALGLRELIAVAGLGRNGLSARDLGYGIGPRLNAAGRLEDAQMAFRLLVTDDRAEARELAETLDTLNRERREIEQRTTAEALQQVGEVSLHETWGLVVCGEGWHEGVVGLVAGRVCRQFNRPALAIAISGDEAKGSGRSTEACDLHAALTGCAELLERFGGHRRAAGLTIEAARLPALRERFNEMVKAQLTPDDLIPVLWLECSLKATAVTLALAEGLEALAPYGEANPEPLFEIRGLRLSQARATRDGVHLQLQFRPDDLPDGPELKAFWPRRGDLAERLQTGQRYQAAAQINVDRFRGEARPQLMIEDLLPDGR